MDAQLRQRLIGAAVLIALAVIFLPMLLNGREEVGSQEVSLDIPPAGSVPAPSDERTVTLPAERTVALPQTPADEDPIATVDTTTAPPAETAPNTPEPISRPPEPVVSTPPPVAPKPVPEVVKPVFDTAASPGGSFYLQLGSYSQAERAKALVDQLGKLGIQAKSDAVTADGRTLYRVRSAGFPNRTVAETARLKAVGAVSGLNASIVEGAVPTPTSPTRTPTDGPIAYAVQLGVFGVEAKAVELSDKLRKAGFPAYVERIKAANGTVMRVRVGPTPKDAQAKTLRDQIKSKLGLEGIVVPHP